MYVVQTDGRGTELRRETVTSGECRNCGTRARDKRSGRLYVYTVFDGCGLRERARLLGAPRGQGKTFCNIDCFKAYNGY